MGIFSWQSFHGLGHHQDTISTADMIEFRKGNLIYATLGAVLGMTFVKISMCLLLMRFVNSKKYVYFLWGLISKWKTQTSRMPQEETNMRTFQSFSYALQSRVGAPSSSGAIPCQASGIFQFVENLETDVTQSYTLQIFLL